MKPDKLPKGWKNHFFVDAPYQNMPGGTVWYPSACGIVTSDRASNTKSGVVNCKRCLVKIKSSLIKMQGELL